MNILVLSWRDPKHPLAGGAEQVMHEHMKGWIKAGHEVTLFSSRTKSQASEEVIDNIKIVRRGNQYLGVQWEAFKFYLKNNKDYDFIVDQFHGIPFFTPIYVRKPKLAVIQEPAREVWLKNPLSFPLNLIIGLIGYVGEPFVFLFYRTTPFLTGSKSAKEDIQDYGIPGKNIYIIPHGVILPERRQDLVKSPVKTVTFLGVLSKDKGIEDALKCFAILSRDRPYDFWVIGKVDTPNYQKRLVSLVKRLEISERVKFWGFVDQQKKFDLLARSWILVNPSVREGWGLVNIEANAMGTPVVAYNSPGLINSVKHGESGIICRKNSSEEMALEIHKLLSSKMVYETLQNQAKRWSSQFSWEKSRKASVDLINTLSNRH